jgi:dolichol-phosphate mannosyltransferase
MAIENTPPRIMLVIPVFNERQCIAAHLAEILARSRPASADYLLEVLLIDDGSDDRTADLLHDIARNEPAISVLQFTRNFGKEAAIQAGIEAVADKADAVILMDSDLQHPPELVPQMVKLWQAGALVVDAQKTTRGKESLASRLFTRLFYGLFRKLAGLDLQGHSDYKLLDRQVVLSYLRLQERQRFFRGLIQWMGYPTATIPFAVPERQQGQSKWSRIKLIRYALTNITAFSSLPLVSIFWGGTISLAIGAIFGSIALYQKLQGIALSGFTTVILLVTIFGGLIMLSMGVIGHYLARIYDEIKARPTYIIRSRPQDPERRP